MKIPTSHLPDPKLHIMSVNPQDHKVPLAPFPKGAMGVADYMLISLNEPPHDKTNKMACAPNEDSDQPGWSVFAVRSKGS